MPAKMKLTAKKAVKKSVTKAKPQAPTAKKAKAKMPAPPSPVVTTPQVELAKKALAKEKAAKEPIQATGPLAQKWSALYKKSEAIESKPYNMRATYIEKTAIVHKVLGWGYILANRNDRLEVLFKDGIKYLISNYK